MLAKTKHRDADAKAKRKLAITQLREDLGLCVSEFAEKVHVSAQTVRRWEDPEDVAMPRFGPPELMRRMTPPLEPPLKSQPISPGPSAEMVREIVKAVEVTMLRVMRRALAQGLTLEQALRLFE